VNLEPGVTWHGYLASDAFGADTCVDQCPRAEDGIGILGFELGLTYRKADAENPIHPVLGIGVYHSTVHDTSKARLGASVGVVVPFRRSARGPALDLRYFRMFRDSRFGDILPISLRWTF
jgi:hypothetical protein